MSAVVSDVDDVTDRLNISCQRRGPQTSTLTSLTPQIRLDIATLFGPEARLLAAVFAVRGPV